MGARTFVSAPRYCGMEAKLALINLSLSLVAPCGLSVSPTLRQPACPPFSAICYKAKGLPT